MEGGVHTVYGIPSDDAKLECLTVDTLPKRSIANALKSGKRVLDSKRSRNVVPLELESISARARVTVVSTTQSAEMSEILFGGGEEPNVFWIKVRLSGASESLVRISSVY